MQSYYYPYVDPILMTRNDFLNHPDHFFSYHDGCVEFLCSGSTYLPVIILD